MQASKEDVRILSEAVTYLVEGAYRGMARTFDITRIGLLRLAATNGSLRPSDAAQVLAVNPSTITRYVKSLEDEGYLVVSPDPADGRSCLIAASEDGLVELARFGEAGAEVFGGVIHDWSAEDIRQFTQLINRLANAWMQRGPVQTRPPKREASPRWRAKTPEAQR